MKKKRFENLETSQQDFTSSSQKSIVQQIKNWGRRIELPPDPDTKSQVAEVAPVNAQPTAAAPPTDSGTAQTKSESTNPPAAPISTSKRKAHRPRGRFESHPDDVPVEKMLDYAKKMPKLVHELKREQHLDKLHTAEMRVLRSVIGVAMIVGVVMTFAPQIMTVRAACGFLLSSALWYLIRKFLF